MHFVVYGAGAVGGVVGARLEQAGHGVDLIARGDNYTAIYNHGITLQTPDEEIKLDLPVVESPSRISWQGDEIVLLAVKSQDTETALEELSQAAPLETPVMCLQNGVANERAVLRRFPNTYGIYVWCVSTFLQPGVVQAWSVPKTGVLDVGKYPKGVDDLAEEVAAAFRESTFYSSAREDVMRFKYRKLLGNVVNAVEALCGAGAGRGTRLLENAKAEALRCFEAAGIAVAGEDEDMATREHTLTLQPISENRWEGGSTWQSLARETGRTEVDYLNGEIVLLGRLHGVPTPVNEALQWLTNQAAKEGAAPGGMTVAEIDDFILKSAR